MDQSLFLPSAWLPAPEALPADVLLAALTSAVATLVLILVFARRLPIGRSPAQAVAPAPDASACDFLLAGSSVRPLTEPARALVADLGAAPSPMAALAAHLARDCPHIQRHIEALVLYGTAFSTHVTRGDGTACEIAGRPEGDAAVLSIRQPSDDARALQDARAALARAGDELQFLRDTFDRAPVLAWSLARDGHVTWANAAYRDAFDTAAGDLPDHRIRYAFGNVLEEVPLTARGDESRARVAVPGRVDGEPRWYEISRCPGPDGSTLGFATDVGDLVAAEASLRRFIETLTETFAHLPIGLAVFDKNRRLGLFNPALTDLVRIDAVWLAGRPSLRDFLERLRETRQMPEQKDFAAWRRKLSELEEGARDGTYEENWVLPSGKIFRVTGRPHPQGALAFLFEDISTTIQLERRYRSDLELSQTTLDRLSEAVAAFDASGSLVFVNAAFEQLWGLDAMERLDGPGVRELTELWAARCAPSPVWAELTEYATAAEARGSWTATVEMRGRGTLQMSVSPLPDTSTLVTFREAGAGAMPRDPMLDELLLDQICLPVEAAVRLVTEARAASSGPDEAVAALDDAVERLNDGLFRARALRTLPAPEPVSDPLPALAATLAARGLGLTLAGVDGGSVDPVLRRSILALGFAAADFATPGATVEISLDAGAPLRRLAVSTAAGPRAARSEDVSLTLARRVIEAAGGVLHLAPAAGRVTLAAELPPPAGEAPWMPALAGPGRSA